MAGPKNAWLDENELRWYTFNERDYLSATSMRKVLGMPFNLHRWVLKQTLEVLQRDPSLLEPQDTGKGKRKPKMETPANVRGRIQRMGMADRDASAERGTIIHDAIATGVPMADIDPELRPYVEQYSNAVISLGIKPILVEKQVFSKRGYAGSFDLLAALRSKDGKRYIVDLKTGKGTYSDHALQGMHYFDADFVGEDDRVDEDATKVLHSCEGIGILHLQPDSWKFYDVPVTTDLRNAARSMASLAMWMVRYPTIESIIQSR